MADKRGQLITKLHSLIGQLDACCKCPDSGVARNGASPTEAESKRRSQESTSARNSCPDSATQMPKPKPWKDIPPPAKRSVPFEVDWSVAPLITSTPIHETRFVSNNLDVDARTDVSIEMRPWLPPPVDLGGNGSAWDLRRYPSCELLTGQMIQGCNCLKRNGLQDQCPRVDCRGSPACLQVPPKCKPSGGPGPEALTPDEIKSTKHKNNCWCPICRPPCGPQKSQKPGQCPGCAAAQDPTCGSNCQHYCDKHMAGTRGIEVPPIMV